MQTSNKTHLLSGTVLAGFVSVGLVACGSGERQIKATPTQGAVSTAPQLGSVTKGEFDIEGVIAYLPDGFVVTYDTSDYAEGTGFTTLTNVRFASEENAEMGIEIGKLVVAGFNKSFVDARIAGTNFSDSAIVLDHLEASDISLFGVEKFYEGYNEALLDVTNDFIEDFSGEDIPEIEQSLDEMSFTIDTILIDDFELMTVELPPEADGGEIDEDFYFLQSFLGYSLSMGAKKVSSQGMRMGFVMTQDGQEMTMNMAMPLAEYEGWRGGDLKRSYAENVNFDLSVPNDEQDDDFPLETIEMSGLFGGYLIEDMRVNEALKWVIRGEMPPVTETDLMSLGRWTMTDTNISIFGAPFYSVDSYIIDLSGFHWLVPTDIELSTENLVYDIGSFLTTIVNLMPEEERADQEELAQMMNALEVLETYDLSAPSMDLSLKWNWNPDTGVGAFSYGSGLDGYGTMKLDIGGAVASFQEFVDVSNQHGFGSEEAEQLFQDKFNLSGIRLEMEDLGGNDRLYDAAKALGEALKDVSPEMATLAAYDTDTMKLLVSSSITGGAAFIREEVPVAFDYAEKLADYLTDGGKFAIALEPDTPMTFEDFEALAELNEGPEQLEPLLEKYGFSVTYTPN